MSIVYDSFTLFSINYIRRDWQKTRDPERKIIFNKINQKLKRLTHDSKKQAIANYLLTLSAGRNTNYSIWKTTMRILRPSDNVPLIRRSDNTWARSNLEKADLHADHLDSLSW